MWLSPQILGLIYHDLPQVSHHVFGLLSLGLLGSLLIGLFGSQVFELGSRPLVFVRALFSGLAIGSVITLALEPWWPIYHVAIGSVVSKWSVGLILIFESRSILGDFPAMAVLKPVLAAGIMSACLGMMGLENSWLNLPIGGVIYLIMAFFLNKKLILNWNRHRLEKS